jgi:hypothetical protein
MTNANSKPWPKEIFEAIVRLIAATVLQTEDGAGLINLTKHVMAGIIRSGGSLSMLIVRGL